MKELEVEKEKMMKQAMDVIGEDGLDFQPLGNIDEQYESIVPKSGSTINVNRVYGATDDNAYASLNDLRYGGWKPD